MEKRKRKRVPRRFNVRFGETDFTHSGFTRDLSPDGAFVVAMNLPPVGSRIHLQVMAGAHHCLFFEGVVCRHRQVPHQLRQLEQAGFGVAFRAPSDLFLELVPAAGGGHHLEVRFADAEQLRRAWAQELRLGGIFVRTDLQLARDCEVVVDLHLDFSGQHHEFLAKVMQAVCVPGAKGLAVSFREPAAVRAALAMHLGS